jgi:serine/threonine protein kinase/Tfp pilus assembly protein PilF
MSEGVAHPGDREPRHSIAPATVPAPPTPTPLVPSRIGRYSILRVLGEGGMGTVYEAQQESPKRAVALKVIRAGHVSPGLLRRFEHESAVLGRLQHPGIAQVYEAGTVQDERGHPVPFFAMEFIRGVPLTDYASSRRLGTRERLDLVARICDAVYHAHQKGVIHRDLKPGNILVDQSGQPKILDFGVARATDSDIQQTTFQTDVGQLIGTIPYMSPEQVGGNPGELDTRSDVYALGVIAFELLAGRLPYDVSRGAIHEAARVIREEEPTRLSSINRSLRGDVETIIAKALEKEKTRRYQSAESLASDIRRYLKDEPITARPASTWYQVRKFSRRNKGLVAGLGAAFVFLGAGLLFSLISRADAVKARNSEKARADELKKVSDFQDKVLAQVNATAAGLKLTEDVNRRFAAALEKDKVPEAERPALADNFRSQWSRVNATDAAAALIDETILKPAVRAIDEQFKDQPVIDAQLRQALADRYRELGLYDASLQLQKQALETRRRALGEEHPDTLSSIFAMSTLLQDQVHFAEAEVYSREALEKRRRVLGEEHPDTLRSIHDLGNAIMRQGEQELAKPLLQEAIDKRRRVLGEDHPDTLVSIHLMAVLLQAQGKLTEAEPYFRETLDKERRLLGEESVETLETLNDLGVLLHTLGKPAEAEACYREALDKMRRVLGEDHPETLMAKDNMGMLLQKRGRLSEAEPYFREILEKRRRAPGEEHTDTVLATFRLGDLLRDQGRFTEAEPLLREAIDKGRRVWGEEHARTLWCMCSLASLREAQGRYQEAFDLLGPIEPAARNAFTDYYTLRLPAFLAKLGRARVGLGYDADRFKLGEANLLEARQVFVKARGEKDTDTLDCVEGLINLYTAWDKAEPGKGYEAKAAEWRAKLDEAPVAPTPPSDPPHP